MEVIRIDYLHVQENLPKSSCCIGFFDGLHTGHQALIENCIIMPDVEIADGAHLKNVIVDKHSRIAKKKDLAGLEEQPLYIGRRENV